MCKGDSSELHIGQVIFLLLIQGVQREKKFRYLKTVLTADLLKTKSVDSFHLLKFQQLLIIYEESGQ